VKESQRNKAPQELLRRAGLREAEGGEKGERVFKD